MKALGAKAPGAFSYSSTPFGAGFFADILGLMAQRQPINLVPYKHELTTQEAASFLRVSRPRY
ncbi:hypothetical protein FNU76_10660 [Chitinimonas arctica]|uniref:Uncharacterized protein n=1 Tax=Chitinimonas arctica TaxID=2594795 RepID=A0A516SF49_9NEIS|nr:hypothetical protein [Chitinimonas arctica]QDQ26787.1 hypothetical protein FNU76_10660 [Chitinimonas arctica]